MPFVGSASCKIELVKRDTRKLNISLASETNPQVRGIQYTLVQRVRLRLRTSESRQPCLLPDGPHVLI